jgi:RND family efflux transporter MFP subunit
MIFKLRLILICALTLFSTAILSCGEKEQSEEIIRPVRYVEAYSTGGTRTRTFSGVARAGLESKLSFKVPGTIELVAVKVGDRVAAGDLIAQLDPSDYQLEVQKAEAALANAAAQARNAEANYERVRALWENKSASTTDLDASRATYESATAGTRSAQKQLELAKAQLSYTTLNAPISGAIAQVIAEKNENVQIGKTVVTLTSSSRIEVEVSIPEVLISLVTDGDKVTVTFDAIPGREFVEIAAADLSM